MRFCFLTNPERFEKDGKLTVRMMALGDPDEQGRRRPVPTEQTEVMQMDALITAIGEQPDCEVLKAMGIPLGQRWLARGG